MRGREAGEGGDRGEQRGGEVAEEGELGEEVGEMG